MANGVLIVNKPEGFTSSDVVAKLRGIFGQRKIGHTGTLDPNATGVLPICLGSATKICDYLTDHTKTYIATAKLGFTTDTQDVWGTIIEEKTKEAANLTSEEVRAAILGFIGDIEQVPPMYSALKVNGKKLYELARAGIEVERKARPITIYDIQILDMKLPEFTIEVTCSKGTYIRTLCHDIGLKLGCGAMMTSLVRTKVGQYTLEDAYTLENLQKAKDSGTLSDYLTRIEDVFPDYPRYVAKGDDATKRLENGNLLEVSMLKPLEDDSNDSAGQCQTNARELAKTIRVYHEKNGFYALYAKNNSHSYKPFQMFKPE